MALSRQQLTAIAARAFPGQELREARQLGPARYELRLAAGETLGLLAYASPAEARTAAAALRLLASEFDLPVPALRAADETGETVGVPYTLIRGVEGETLAAVRERIPDGQRYAIGQQLGEVAQRVHRLAVRHFGPLGAERGAPDERAYGRARFERDLAACASAGLVNNVAVEAVRAWFEREFQPVGREAALVHGDLSPEVLLVRRGEAGWRLSAVLGWERALGWNPAWEHATLLENSDAMRDFALRVGYGNAYDERTKRAYEQVRETAMAPYRALLLLERMREAHAASELAAAERARNGLLSLVQNRNES